MKSETQLIGAGASMSPGSHIRALTAKNATANMATINMGKRVERRNPKTKINCNIILL